MGTNALSRRQFVRLSALSLGTALAAACGAAPTATPLPKPTAAPTTAAAAPTATKPAAAPTAVPTAAAGGKKTLRVYWNAGHHYTTYKNFATQFEKDTGYAVQWEIYQWPDMRTKLLANFAAGDVPDVSEDSGPWCVEFAVTGNTLLLTPFIDKYGKEMGFPDDWQPAALTPWMYKKEYAGIKLHHTCTLLFYNIDLFDKAGVKPALASWEDFLTACQATAKGNVFGFSPNQSSGYTTPWFMQNGVTQYDPDKNRITLDNDAAYEAFQFQADLIHKHKVAPIPIAAADYEGPQKLFSANRAAIILTGPWDVKPILDSSPNVKWGMIQPLKRKVQATSGAGAGMFIPKKAKNPDVSFDFMRKITALDIEMQATKEANMLMPRKSWAANKDVLAMERIAPFAQALGTVVEWAPFLGLSGKSGAIGDLFEKAYQDTIYKNVPASQSLKEFSDAANKLLTAT
jgi:multiple sugar transport system substrate-binding protein